MMTITTSRIAVAAVLWTLSIPALAADAGPDCSVCDDPTWPEIRDPMPAVVIREDGAGSATVQTDPTWPEIPEPAAVIVLRSNGTQEPAAVQSDPTWPALSSVAPPLAVERPEPERRVVHR